MSDVLRILDNVPVAIFSGGVNYIANSPISELRSTADKQSIDSRQSARKYNKCMKSEHLAST